MAVLSSGLLELYGVVVFAVIARTALDLVL